MKLIDADGLEKDINSDPTDGLYKHEIIQVIREQPTIDPASLVKRGRWEDKPTGAYGRWQSWCTACGKHSGIGGIESNRHKPFCPNCGALMVVEDRRKRDD